MSKEENLFSILGVDTDIPVWSGMPHHCQEQNEADYVLCISIKDEKDLHYFADLIGQEQIKSKTKTNVKSIWYPKLVQGERGSNSNYCWISTEDL